MSAAETVVAVAPALLFLRVGVPLASLLDDVGFFAAAASLLQRGGRPVPVVGLWVLAGLTTAVLNLDTTVVLLTPLYIRLARRAGVDPFALALVPLFMASFASSVLPVSNLTTLIAAERLDLSVGAVVTQLALPGLGACVAGWFVYRRRYPVTVASVALDDAGGIDRRALAIGSAVVAGLLVGFVLGPRWGIDAWVVVLAADVVLVALTRRLPWREVPVLTALGVAAVALVASLVVPTRPIQSVLAMDGPSWNAALVGAGAGVANVVNNIPATMLALEGTDAATSGLWAWLLGVNAGAALAPIGALANLLWWRLTRAEGVEITPARYLRATVPVVTIAVAAAAICFVLQDLLTS